MTKRLRLAHIILQPVLVWDDGTELTDGPDVQPLKLSLSGLEQFAVDLPDEIAKAEAKALAAEKKP